MTERIDTSFIRRELIRRMSRHDVDVLAQSIRQMQCPDVQRELCDLMFGKDIKLSRNAARLFLHLAPTCDQGYLQTRKGKRIDRVLTSGDNTLSRLLLSLLLQMPFDKEDFHTALFDFCLNTVASAHKPVSLRVLCLKMAYVLGKIHPTLLREMMTVVEHTKSLGNLSPGMQVAIRDAERAVAAVFPSSWSAYGEDVER